MGLSKTERGLLRLAQIWWAGFKVLCRWSAFWIILAVLSLPAAGLTYVVGQYAGRILRVASLVLTVPIAFYLTSRYLLLLGDDDRSTPDGQEGAVDVGGSRGVGMWGMIIITIGAAFFVGALLGPPDALSQLMLGAETALLCAIPLLILGRCKFVRGSSESIRTLVCVLVCLLAIVSVQFHLCLHRIVTLERRMHDLADSSQDTSIVSPPEQTQEESGPRLSHVREDRAVCSIGFPPSRK